MTLRICVSPRARLLLLLLLALSAMVAFMMIDAGGHWNFILPFRGRKLIAMVLVAVCVAVSSVLFQTITHNRILTPGIMGFDALYVLIQAITIFVSGAQAISQVQPLVAFVRDTAIMTLLATVLFYWIFSGAERSLYRLVLVGIVFGLLFRSLSSLVVRLIDPNEFLVLQDRMFASFNFIQVQLLSIACVLVAALIVPVFRLRRHYDVLMTGRAMAISLGLAYRHLVMLTLLLIAVMVSVSTGLVGPVTFFGLLVSNLAYMIMGSDKHEHTLPAAVLLAVTLLIGGQALLEHVLALSTPVSVVIEFAGGLMFIFLIIRGARR